MVPKLFVTGLVIILALLLGVSSATGQQEVTASTLTPYSFAFTYQGQLQDADGPVTGTCDLQFRLWDAASEGLQVGNLLEINGIQLQAGLFTAKLDFGAEAHTGGARWLEISVRCPAGSSSYETLAPRQELTAAPAALSLALPFRTQANNYGPLIWIENTNTSGTLSTGVFGSGYVGLSGYSSSVGGMGVRGSANPDSGVAYGVYGESASPNGFGVYGQATAESGATLGVSGYSSSTSGTGVYGWAGASSGETYGVYGKSSSDTGIGVYGNATASSGETYGVYGECSSSQGAGVYGTGYKGVYGVSSSSSGTGVTGVGFKGIYGVSTSDQGTGVYGVGEYGVVGTSSTQAGTGVYGSSDALMGIGVYGVATADNEFNAGVYGSSESTSGRGVHGLATALSGSTSGVSGNSFSPSGTGVSGTASAGSGSTTGVYGESISTSGRGVIGDATSETGTTYGVVGYSASPDGYAGYFRNTSSGRGLYVQSDTGTGNIIEARSSFSEIVFRVERGGDVYADGSFIDTGADYAELLPASAGLQAGDVLVIGADGKLTRSTTPSQTSVVGVYSTQPGFLAGAGEDGAVSEDQVPLAVMGVVPVKVTAENGPIQPGDLLTTSSTLGHAMRAGPDPLPGTVIGKALESWESGVGVIQMLVMLR